MDRKTRVETRGTYDARSRTIGYPTKKGKWVRIGITVMMMIDDDDGDDEDDDDDDDDDGGSGGDGGGGGEDDGDGGDSGRFDSNRYLLSGSDERLTSVRGGILSGQ